MTMTGGDMAAQLTEEMEITGGDKKVLMMTEAMRGGSRALFMLNKGSDEIVQKMKDREEDPLLRLLTRGDAHMTEKKGGSRHHQLGGGSLRGEIREDYHHTSSQDGPAGKIIQEGGHLLLTGEAADTILLPHHLPGEKGRPEEVAETRRSTGADRGSSPRRRVPVQEEGKRPETTERSQTGPNPLTLRILTDTSDHKVIGTPRLPPSRRSGG